jgi:hypothetical protein
MGWHVTILIRVVVKLCENNLTGNFIILVLKCDHSVFSSTITAFVQTWQVGATLAPSNFGYFLLYGNWYFECVQLSLRHFRNNGNEMKDDQYLNCVNYFIYFKEVYIQCMIVGQNIVLKVLLFSAKWINHCLIIRTLSISCVYYVLWRFAR